MNAREVALKIVNEVHTDGAYANVALSKELYKQTLSDQDRRFVTELVYGTVKAGLTIDWILSNYINRPLHKIAPIVQDILRLGIYQLFFMSKIPASAACNQAVEMTKKYGHSGTVKFVNAVLRNAVRSPEKAKYPSRAENLLKNLSLEYYHPEWLLKQWINRFGIEDTVNLCQFNNQNPPLSIRANTLKNSRTELLSTLIEEQVQFEESNWAPEGIVCTSHPSMKNLPSLKEGKFQVQDESSMLVAHILDPKPGELIIDTCSAPGGKTTHIAALMKNKGKIIATDIYEHKLKKIEENASRLGIDIIHTELLDAINIGDLYKNQADRVLVDAPCSGLGVLRRKPDARWRKTASLLQELPKLQRIILASAANAVKPGGILVYSTCTIEEEENQQIIHDFLANRTDFKLENAEEYLPYKLKTGPLLAFFPHIDHIDGFFIARMKRDE